MKLDAVKLVLVLNFSLHASQLHITCCLLQNAGWFLQELPDPIDSYKVGFSPCNVSKNLWSIWWMILCIKYEQPSLKWYFMFSLRLETLDELLLQDTWSKGLSCFLVENTHYSLVLVCCRVQSALYCVLTVSPSN